MSIRREADRSVWLALLATAAGFAFTFSGAVISGLGYPHFEAGIAACFLMFLGLHFLNLRRASWVALAIGLAIREDAGLHYAGYLMLIALYQWRSGAWPMPRRTVMGALAISVAASVAMLAVQRYYFPLGASMFDKSFVGTPPFAHVNAAELSRRVSAFLTGSPAIYVPAIVVAVAALVARAPILLLGYAACVPWVVLNVVFSLTPAAETLSLYYGFPLLVGLAWPIVATHWMRTQPASRAKRYAMPAFFAAAIGSALVLPHHRQVDASAIAGGKSVCGRVHARAGMPRSGVSIQPEALRRHLRRGDVSGIGSAGSRARVGGGDCFGRTPRGLCSTKVTGRLRIRTAPGRFTCGTRQKSPFRRSGC
jgi:hypothetical protein